MKSNSQPTTIANRYQVVSRIGEGGMGVVYEAHDPLLNITVAIKQMRQDDATSAAVMRFQNEAVALGKLNHPNIARVLDFAYEESSTYMVMEYLDGTSYYWRLKHGELSVLEHLNIFAQICKGLIHAHKNGVLHRDLKPSNIMLVKNEHATNKYLVKIVDFGIAKLETKSQSLTTTGALIGSPYYLSPEQAQARNVDSRSDIYSMGCLMFEALTGRPPLMGDSYIETVNLHIYEPPPRINDKNPGEFPEKLEHLIDRCLEKDAENRFQNVQQVLTELEDVIEHMLEELAIAEEEEAEAREQKDTTDGDQSEAKLSSRSNKIFVAALAGFILLIGGISLFLKNQGSQTTDAKVSRSPGTALLKTMTKEIDRRGFVEFPPLDEDPQFKQEINYDSETKTLRAKWVGSEVSFDLGVKNWDLPIQHLELTDCNVDGRFFSKMRAKEVDSVKLVDTKITDENMQLTKAFTNLTGFEFNRNELLTEKAFDCLPAFNKLVYLSIDPAYVVTDRTINKMAHLRDVSVVTLRAGTQITDASVDAIRQWKKLNRLLLYKCGFTADGLARVVEPAKLIAFSHEQGPFNNNLCNALVKKPLTYLKLEQMKLLNTSQFKKICTIKSLTWLSLDCRFVDKEALKSLSQLNNVTKLYLYGAKWSDEVNEFIANSNIDELKLDESTITPEQVLALSKMRRIQNLNLIHFEPAIETALTEVQNKILERTGRKIVVRFEGPKSGGHALDGIGVPSQ